MNILELYASMQKDGIRFFNYRMQDEKSITIGIDEHYGVFIDTERIESQAEETCIVAHEYGHCATGATHKICSDLDLISRHEYKADKYAVHLILPLQDLKNAFDNGCVEIWELAEYFNYTEDFISRAIFIYQCEELL